METDTVMVLALVFLELPAAFILGYGLGTALESAKKRKERNKNEQQSERESAAAGQPARGER